MLKYDKLEKKAIIIRSNKSKLYEFYDLVDTITVADLDNIDIAIKLVDKLYNKKLKQNEQVKLLNKLTTLFQRKSAEIDGDERLNAWLNFLEVDYIEEENYIIFTNR